MLNQIHIFKVIQPPFMGASQEKWVLHSCFHTGKVEEPGAQANIKVQLTMVDRFSRSSMGFVCTIFLKLLHWYNLILDIVVLTQGFWKGKFLQCLSEPVDLIANQAKTSENSLVHLMSADPLLHSWKHSVCLSHWAWFVALAQEVLTQKMDI